MGWTNLEPPPKATARLVGMSASESKSGLVNVRLTVTPAALARIGAKPTDTFQIARGEGEQRRVVRLQKHRGGGHGCQG